MAQSMQVWPARDIDRRPQPCPERGKPATAHETIYWEEPKPESARILAHIYKPESGSDCVCSVKADPVP